jgi:hypothetical protein
MCFKPLRFCVICYTEIDNQHKTKPILTADFYGHGAQRWYHNFLSLYKCECCDILKCKDMKAELT